DLLLRPVVDGLAAEDGDGILHGRVAGDLALLLVEAVLQPVLEVARAEQPGLLVAVHLHRDVAQAVAVPEQLAAASLDQGDQAGPLVLPPTGLPPAPRLGLIGFPLLAKGLPSGLPVRRGPPHLCRWNVAHHGIRPHPGTRLLRLRLPAGESRTGGENVAL